MALSNNMHGVVDQTKKNDDADINSDDLDSEQRKEREETKAKEA
jgi:hypothetical protein